MTQREQAKSDKYLLIGSQFVGLFIGFVDSMKNLLYHQNYLLSSFSLSGVKPTFLFDLKTLQRKLLLCPSLAI